MVTDSKPTDWQTLAVLRFLLASVVVAGHLKAFVDHPAGWIVAVDAFGGKAAVMGFLLVSGYSIGASLERGSAGFYKRRFLRIYPLYLFALAFAACLQLAAGARSTWNLPDIVNGGDGWVTLTGNLLLLQTFVVKPLAFDGPVWSLAIEVFYYLLAPVFARMRVGALLALVVLSAACYPLPRHPEWGVVYFVLTRFNALRYLWCWLLGFVIRRERTAVVLLVGALGAVPVLVGQDTVEPLCIVTYALSFVLIAGARMTKLPAGLHRVADYLGDLSYPLYLIHFPTFILATKYLRVDGAAPLLLGALVMTAIAYHLIDEQLKPRYVAPLVEKIVSSRKAVPRAA